MPKNPATRAFTAVNSKVTPAIDPNKLNTLKISKPIIPFITSFTITFMETDNNFNRKNNITVPNMPTINKILPPLYELYP